MAGSLISRAIHRLPLRAVSTSKFSSNIPSSHLTPRKWSKAWFELIRCTVFPRSFRDFPADARHPDQF